jgi:hypothetical protein
MNSPTVQDGAQMELGPLLFGKGDLPLYAVLDGASVPDLVKKLYEHEPEYCCLYRGELEPDMAVVAPYLVRLEAGNGFADWILLEGWGAHWGIFLLSPANLRALRDHFREFQTVELPDQRTVLFRYYDPRVLRTFLPACNAAELETFFGPVRTFMVEGDSPESGLKYSIVAKALKPEAFQIKKKS